MRAALYEASRCPFLIIVYGPSIVHFLLDVEYLWGGVGGSRSAAVRFFAFRPSWDVCFVWYV